MKNLKKDPTVHQQVYVMNPIKIADATKESIDDLINLCIPGDKKDDPAYIKGMKAKREWAAAIINLYGSFAKVAYVGSALTGMVQYTPDIDERIIKIHCIFVPDGHYQKRGTGTTLVKSLIGDMKAPKSYFNNKKLRAVVTYAFDVPGLYPQHKFYQKMGFNQANDPHLFYYPLQKEYIPQKKEFVPQEKDKGKVLIFYDPSCPHCIRFLEKTIKSIRDVTDIPIESINIYENREEVTKRGTVPHCVVNKTPITSCALDADFQSEVRKALDGPG
jgi:N-acetylglutamate synthase-like GNAT family acetyltransferase/glutaredoxin